MSRPVTKRKADVVFILILVGVVALAGLGLHLFRHPGDAVEVAVDGKVVATYPLTEDRTEDIRTGADQQQLNRLVIEGGKARVETATCPDGICAGHRPIRRQGESIICLPHRVVVTVISATDDGPDIVA